MKKAFLLPFLFLGLLPGAIALPVNTTLNVTANNNTINILAEGMNLTFDLTNQTTVSVHQLNLTRDNLTIVLETNTSCISPEVVTTLADTNKKIADTLSGFQNYYELYVGCFGNLSTANTKLEACNGKKSFETEYSSCQTDVSKLTGEKAVALTSVDSLTNQTGNLRVELNEQKDEVARWKVYAAKVEQQRVYAGIAAAIAAFAIAWWFFVKRHQVKEPKDEIMR